MDSILFYENILRAACDSFISKIDQYNWALLYESDFRCALYTEIINIMEERGLDNFPIRTEHQYGNNDADIALGDNQEIAIELKFSYTYFPLNESDFIKAKNQILAYLENGAKKAYFICLDHQVPPDNKSLAEKINIEEIGFSGEWREVNGKEVSGDKFLIAELFDEGV